MSEALPVVDAHHHLWDLSGGPLHYPWLQDPVPHEFFLGDYAALKRNYLPEDYRRDAAGQGVVKTVHVEAECSRAQQLEETEWLTALSAAHGMPNAIVAHAWFHTPEAEAILERQAAFPLVRGIRSKPVTATRAADMRPGAPGSMQDPVWLAGYRLLRKFGLSWDLRVPPWHLEEAAAVLRANPDVPVVLNHTGFPGTAAKRASRCGVAACARWRLARIVSASSPACVCRRATGMMRAIARWCARRSSFLARRAACSPRTFRWTACACPSRKCSRISGA